MSLYIEVVDGRPVNHPIMASNLALVYPGLDEAGLRALGYEPFVRVPLVQTTDKVFVRTEYELVGGVWTDVHYFRDLTPEEIAEHKRQRREVVTNFWQNQRSYAHNFTAWVYDETLERFVPPFPKPDDGKFYRWSGPDNNWKEAPPFPDDGKKYHFDFDNWVNIEAPTNV
jgi:hypothetical protein